MVRFYMRQPFVISMLSRLRRILVCFLLILSLYFMGREGHFNMILSFFPNSSIRKLWNHSFNYKALSMNVRQGFSFLNRSVVSGV